MISAESSGVSSNALPKGWEAVEDDEVNTYYYHEKRTARRERSRSPPARSIAAPCDEGVMSRVRDFKVKTIRFNLNFKV